MAKKNTKAGYRIYAEHELPEQVIAYLEEGKASAAPILAIMAFYALSVSLIMLPIILTSVVFNDYRMESLAKQLWNLEPALLVSAHTNGFVITMIVSAILFSPWVSLFIASPIKSSRINLAVWLLKSGKGGLGAGLNRDLNRFALRRVPERLADNPPAYLTEFSWRMAGLWARGGLWITGLALVLLFFDLNNISVATRTAIHDSPYFSTAMNRHSLARLQHIEVGCTYENDEDGSYLNLYYRLILPKKEVFNLAIMEPAKGRLIDTLEQFDKQFAARGIPVLRAQFKDGKPKADKACADVLTRSYGQETAQRWIKLLRLDKEIP